MLLGKRTANKLLRRLSDQQLRRRVETVIHRFQTTFPQVEYDVLWGSRTCNAQAFVSCGRMHVRLYGGLARHKKISVAGIAWIVAHETGHHLGGLPLHPYFPSVKSEESADVWAMSVGLPKVFGHRLARRYGKFGRREAIRVVG